MPTKRSSSTAPIVDANSLVEGAEFQRSLMVGEFSAVGYVDLTLTGTYWDAFDDDFAAAYAATGLTLNLPNDALLADARLHRPHGRRRCARGRRFRWRRSPAGSITTAATTACSIAAPEQGIGGVTLELLDANGNPTGITTTTSTNPATLGFYEFRNLFPGTYGVREVQPAGWLDGKDTAGSHGGTAASETAGRVDRIFGAVLDYGDHGVEYNFGELLPGSISGRVHADHHEDCDFDDPEILLAGVRIDLLDAQRQLHPLHAHRRQRRVPVHRPRARHLPGPRASADRVLRRRRADRLGRRREARRAGHCTASSPASTSAPTSTRFNTTSAKRSASTSRATSTTTATMTATSIAAARTKRRSPASRSSCSTARGIDTGLRATTDANGFYKFTNLAAGTYTVVEVHPAGWLDGKDTPGNLGGVADVSPPGDRLSQIVDELGR